MNRMLFGMETELAFAAWQRADGGPADASGLLRDLYWLANTRLVSLPEGNGPGMFLANGARFYLDRGNHPEVCTPECQTPAEVVRWQLACERILGDLVREVEKRHPTVQAALFRCNVDYGGSGVTWGCHESYQHKRSHAELAPQLIPHLVTRLVYTGAGGFNNRKNRLEFLLSPRVPHLVYEVGEDVPERAIYNKRDEALSRGGFKRLHVVCGESLCSELANYLKFGTTALVVRLVDAGVALGSTLALADARNSMGRLARDPGARVRLELADGRKLSAVEIQAEFLGMVERQLGADFMPEWAPEVCRRWRQVLEQLESGPESLATSLDWSIKHSLFRDRLDRAGVRDGELLRASDLGAELCEIDTRFGELSDRALFHALDEAGALSHRIPERGSIEDALLDPPGGARAEARGRAIRELHADRERYQCSWDLIRDRENSRFLDLGDPFATSAEWRASPAPPPPSVGSTGLSTVLLRRLQRGTNAYTAHDLEGAVATLEPAILELVQAGDRDREMTARFWCSSAHHDRGNLDAAESVLEVARADLPGVTPESRMLARTRHTLIQIERPAPLAEIERSLERAREACEPLAAGIGRSRISTLEARVLGARGQHAEAAAGAERAWAQFPLDPNHFNEASHLRWLVTFLLRAGLYKRALKHLEVWRERNDGFVANPYSGTSLAVAESALALRLGRTTQAYEHASHALERSEGSRLHRCRAAACVAFLESAAASGKLERTDEVLEELRGWRDAQIGELRFDMHRAEALVHRAKRSGDVAAASAAAREEAATLDARLACTRYVRELDEQITERS